MRRRSSFLPRRRPEKVEGCPTFWPRAACDAAACNVHAALERLEGDSEVVQKTGRLRVDTRAALASLRAQARMGVDWARYVANIEGLPGDVRADLLGAAERFLVAQRGAIERVRESLRA